MKKNLKKKRCFTVKKIKNTIFKKNQSKICLLLLRSIYNQYRFHIGHIQKLSKSP